MFNILVCEDEKNIKNLMAEYLEREKYNVFIAENGEEALGIMDQEHIDLLITDVMMPKMDGHSLVRLLRAAGYEIPILTITAKETIEDKKIGFSVGTDDYMVKPIDMAEMLMRVDALLRRARQASEKKLTIGNTIFNYNDFTVSIGAKIEDMPKKEFLLIFKLLSVPNRILTRMQLMDEIWGYDTESDEQTVNVHISHLRDRFSNNKDFKIVTVKGIGYKAVLL
ncbi:MAG: response regulator transcription factor [Anaerovoracaceae bacterium]